jgi:hypothetical protein
MLAWVARGQAGPTPPLVVEVAASVTPCRHPAGPTVLDEHRHARARGSAASLGGDVVGADQVPVPLEPAMRAAKLAALGFGDPLVAGWAGGGGAPFVHQPHHDACLFGLVAQGLHKVGAAPPPQPEVVHPAHLPASDPFGIANQQGADALPHREGDDLFGGLVLGLVDATAMASLDLPQSGPVAAPPPGAALPRRWHASGGLGLPRLLIRKMQPVLGAERPPRHQQPRLLGGDRVGMDDPQVHPGHPTPRIQVMVLDRHRGGDRQPQPPTISQQGDRPTCSTG